MSKFVPIVARSVVLIAHAIWAGGFTFYSTAVLWVLDDEFGTVEMGRLVTRRVTDWMNAAGIATLALWWFLAWLERRSGSRLARRIRLGLLVASTALLVFLIVDHRILDHRLDTDQLTGFYAMHAVYLIASAAQWVANLLLVPASVWIWNDDPRRGLSASGPS